MYRIAAYRTLPKYVSSDHDPLFQSHRWLANLRILGIEEIKTIPFTPVSHPFVERLIGTIGRKLLDQVLFSNQIDLERKLAEFRTYYNLHRVQSWASRPKSVVVAHHHLPQVFTIVAGNSIAMGSLPRQSARDLDFA